MKDTFNTEARADPWTPLTPDIPLQEFRGHTALKKAPGDCKEAPTPEQNRRLAQAMMAFTTDLFSLVAQRSTSPNLILSPLSVALALSHLALGTVAAPVQTSRAGRPVGTHLSRVTPPLESLGCLIKCRPTFNLCETDSQGLSLEICFW